MPSKGERALGSEEQSRRVVEKQHFTVQISIVS